MRKYIITTLGCKVNQSESDAMARVLNKAGLTPVQKGETADVCIINTCTVTGKASMQSRQAVRKIIRSHPGARVVVTGCYAQLDPDAFHNIEGVSDIVGHREKSHIPKMLIDTMRHNDHSARDQLAVHDQMDAHSSRSRPFIKIQDGCDAFCSYCIVPLARGSSKSVIPEAVLDDIRQFTMAGYQEVVLTGVHMGRYGLDLSPATDLFALLMRIDREKPIHRVRLSSIEPGELTARIIDLVAESESFCRHFHVPLQSGDNRILKMMNRPYDRSLFQEIIMKVSESSGDAAIGTDILVGFPAETEAAFENTYALIDKLPISYLHVFPFSPRQGTQAMNFADTVPADIIKTRSRKMRDLGLRKKRAFYEKFIGRHATVIVEGKASDSDTFLKGTTSNYIPVFFSGSNIRKHSRVEVTIDRIEDNGMVMGLRV